MDLLKPRRSSKAKTAPRPDSCVEYRSAALSRIERELSEKKSCTILDLGAASGKNLEFYRRFSRKIHFADLFSVVAEAKSRPVPAEVVADLAPYSGKAHFDAVLCWDIIEYLEPPEVAALGEALARCCREDTWLVAMTSLAREIPAVPGRFAILGEGQVRVEHSLREMRPNPRYAKGVLARLMPQFKRAHTYLLRRGVEEHLWTFAPAAAAQPHEALSA
jgi:hypothetical protein